MTETGKTPSVLPWQAILVIVLVLVGGVLLLLPDKGELVDRYLESGDPEKALEELEKGRGKDPLFIALNRLEANEMIARERKEAFLWTEAFVRGVEDYVALGGPAALRKRLEKTADRLSDPADAFGTVREPLQTLGRPAARPIENALISRMLASGDPAAAADLFRKFFPTESFGMEDLEKLLSLRRMAGQEERALADLEELRQSLPEEPGTDIDLAIEEARLLRSLNRVGEAFDLLYALWEENPDVVRNGAYYEWVRALSIAADRQPEVVQIVQARVEEVPEDGEVFQDSLDLTMALVSVEEAARLLEERREQGELSREQEKLLARIREWTGEPGEAFDEYRRLALSGDAEAVKRLFELNEGLFRHFELAEILEQAPDSAVSDSLLEKARLLARIGEYEKAGAVYRRVLESAEEKPEIWAELADIALTMHDFPLAIDSYRRALSLEGPEAKAIRWRKDLGWILSLEGEYEQALAEYQQVFDRYGEQDVLPSIVSLASILGDRDLYRNTLEKIVTLNEGESAYEDVGTKLFRQKEFGAEQRWADTLNEFRRSYAQILADDGRTAEAVDVIRQHRDLFSDPEVFEFYLSVLAGEGRFDEGARALESAKFSANLLRSPDSLRTAVWVLESSGRIDRALVLARNLVGRFPGDATAGLTLARLLAATGRTVEAGTLLDEYVRSDPAPEVLLLASDAASQAGRYADAEEFLIRYIETKERPDAEDYSRLGDLRLAAGDRQGARESYQLAVRALLKKGEGG